MSFRRRLIVLVSAAVAVAILAASGVAYVLVRAQLRGEIDSALRDEAGAVFSIAVGPETGVENNGDLLGPLPAPLPGEKMPGQVSGVTRIVVPQAPLGGPAIYAQVVNADGALVKAPIPGVSLPVTKAVREVASGKRDAFFSDTTVNGVHARVYTRPIGSGEALQAARSLDEVDTSLRRLALVLGAVSLGGIALAALLGFAVARSALRPVARLTAAAEQVAHTRDLSRRIDEGGRDELSRLAGSFNEMLAALEVSVAALERSVTAQRQLVADASHELRTPLTSLRTTIEVLAHVDDLPEGKRKQLSAHVVAQLADVGSLVSDLVDLARDGDLDEPREPLRLDLLVQEMAARAQVRCPDLVLDLDAEPCTVVGAEGALERAVGNLLDNAAKFSPQGEDVVVRVSASGEVTVRDHGTGIADEDIPHVFDRFYRAASARGLPGSGLGLAIVQQVAEAHGGSVAVEAAGGGGACLRLRIPTAGREPLADRLLLTS
jgi:two-component system sensor histidine kinase MprB